MKKALVLFVSILSFTSIFAQNFLNNDASNSITTDFSTGIPKELKKSFVNFKSKRTFDNIAGLSKESYVTTNAQVSTITIEEKNIARLVIYAKLFNKKDSLLFNHNHKRKGKLTIKAFRNKDLVNELTSIINFDEDIFQQIHFNTFKAGIHKIQVDFETENDLFILEKFSLLSYNDIGVNHYKELEQIELDILNLENNLEGEVEKLKGKYKEEIKIIQSSHTALSSLINGKKFENIAIVQSNSLNPFNNENFTKHYNGVLEKANTLEREKVDKLTADLKKNNFSNVASTLDNLFLGGKFSSVINMMDSLFDTNINLFDSSSKPISVVKLDNSYYSKKESKKGDLKLTLVEDKTLLKDINLLNQENKAYKIYVNDIANFLKKDTESLIQLNEDIANAKVIRSDLEDLTWNILKGFTKSEKSLFIKDNGIDFLEVGSDLEKNFRPDELTNISDLKLIRSESIISIKKLNEIMQKYGAITSKIKTHYDLIYDIRPRERKKHFDALDKLPPSLKIDWKNKQDEIIDEYGKKGGLKDFLEKITGNE